MKLVSLPRASADAPEKAGLPAELAAALATLRLLLPQPGDLLPEDPQIISRQWPRDSVIDAGLAPRLLDRLIALGQVRRVILGQERYLCLTASREPAPPRVAAQPEGGEDAENQKRFQLQMIADVESERILLFRVGIVLELLALLVLLRHCLLWYLAL